MLVAEWPRAPLDRLRLGILQRVLRLLMLLRLNLMLLIPWVFILTRVWAIINLVSAAAVIRLMRRVRGSFGIPVAE